MIKAAALALLAAAILLPILGVNAMNSAGSDLPLFFSGAATDRANWRLAGGILMLVAGLAVLLSVLRKN